MQLSRDHEYLAAQMGEAGAGAIVIYSAWRKFDSTGVFAGYDSDNATTIDNTTQTTFLPIEGTAGIKEVASIVMHNSDASNVRTITIFLGRTPGSLTKRFRASLPVGATLEYTPAIGWAVYGSDGKRL